MSKWFSVHLRNFLAHFISFDGTLSICIYLSLSLFARLWYFPMNPPSPHIVNKMRCDRQQCHARRTTESGLPSSIILLNFIPRLVRSRTAALRNIIRPTSRAHISGASNGKSVYSECIYIKFGSKILFYYWFQWIRGVRAHKKKRCATAAILDFWSEHMFLISKWQCVFAISLVS